MNLKNYNILLKYMKAVNINTVQELHRFKYLNNIKSNDELLSKLKDMLNKKQVFK